MDGELPWELLATAKTFAGQGAFQGGVVPQYLHPIIIPLSTIAS